MDPFTFAARGAAVLIGSRLRRQDGQALIEYALVLFLVAVVSVTILGTLGGAVSSMFSLANHEF